MGVGRQQEIPTYVGQFNTTRTARSHLFGSKALGTISSQHSPRPAVSGANLHCTSGNRIHTNEISAHKIN